MDILLVKILILIKYQWIRQKIDRWRYNMRAGNKAQNMRTIKFV